ncbi:transcription termination factor NusA [Syntrophorhabdus aromaticivorans]|jgi:N utilization substance protein A|uniref:Transcription termination/antitermination protein NusA n=1 Tax=Syntrophorhabdus aromaticivorans TaxID=328301 RepID=A0A351U1A0_9BACT|nr:transcription termination factor NusA [Syntrophorhabdus aromaticivorans]NLW35485.1 transcription termination/antitermination protein NusA [Syntrophorhabdus aromaticivorans]HBA53731.1 transcription termination/antitermination protein NusA [Syntrophorhabdus aromaticivorans]
MYFDLNYVIEQVGKEKGIPKETLIQALEEAILLASKKKFGNHLDLEARYNEELGEIEVFQFKTVVEEVAEEDMEISLDAAKVHDPECETGDSIGIKMDTSSLGRIAAQTAKQVIVQKVRNAESDVVYNEYKNKKGEVATGIIQRVEKNHYVVNLGKTEAILPVKEVIPAEMFRQRDRVKAFILDVEKTQKGCTILMSRTHPNFLAKLFEMEVPEIQEGIIKVIGAAREPGERAKISVYSEDPDVDPIGACVGVKGSRVQTVVQELRGEKIDIIPFSRDHAKFVCNTLAPARVSKVYINEEEHAMEVIVNDDQLSLAIGKKGQNVRLASRLTGWKIDINSESEVEVTSKKVIDDLMERLKISEILARILHDEYLRDPRDIAKLTPEEMNKITSISVEDCKRIIEQSRLIRDEIPQDAVSEKKVLETPEAEGVAPTGEGEEETGQATTP